MFKTTSEKQSFQQRVASHSTKGFANGRVEVLPPEAQTLEIVYSDMKEQFDVSLAQWRETQAEIEDVKFRLHGMKPGREADTLKERLRTLGFKLNAINTAMGEHRKLARDAGERAFSTCFMFIAERTLPKEVFKRIDIETEQMMGRRRHEVANTTQQKKRQRARNV